MASVKPANLTFLQLSPQRSGGLIRWSTMLNLVIEYAYAKPNNRMVGR